MSNLNKHKKSKISSRKFDELCDDVFTVIFEYVNITKIIDCRLLSLRYKRLIKERIVIQEFIDSCKFIHNEYYYDSKYYKCTFDFMLKNMLFRKIGLRRMCCFESFFDNFERMRYYIRFLEIDGACFLKECNYSHVIYELMDNFEMIKDLKNLESLALVDTVNYLILWKFDWLKKIFSNCSRLERFKIQDFNFTSNNSITNAYSHHAQTPKYLKDPLLIIKKRKSEIACLNTLKFIISQNIIKSLVISNCFLENYDFIFRSEKLIKLDELVLSFFEDNCFTKTINLFTRDVQLKEKYQINKLTIKFTELTAGKFDGKYNEELKRLISYSNFKIIQLKHIKLRGKHFLKFLSEKCYLFSKDLEIIFDDVFFKFESIKLLNSLMKDCNSDFYNLKLEIKNLYGFFYPIEKQQGNSFYNFLVGVVDSNIKFSIKEYVDNNMNIMQIDKSIYEAIVNQILQYANSRKKFNNVYLYLLQPEDKIRINKKIFINDILIGNLRKFYPNYIL